MQHGRGDAALAVHPADLHRLRDGRTRRRRLHRGDRRLPAGHRHQGGADGRTGRPAHRRRLRARLPLAVRPVRRPRGRQRLLPARRQGRRVHGHPARLPGRGRPRRRDRPRGRARHLAARRRTDQPGADRADRARPRRRGHRRDGVERRDQGDRRRRAGARRAVPGAAALQPRDHECEADEIGLRFAIRAGYDPRAAPALWERMAALGDQGPTFLSTHPDPADRAERLRALIPRLVAEEAARRAAPRR
ncbi:MAG: hypothetical protein FJ265_13735 [Planctomycetes bacterium]|nr:hypothetical protein [Planctomycetota bacterium]